MLRGGTPLRMKAARLLKPPQPWGLSDERTAAGADEVADNTATATSKAAANVDAAADSAPRKMDAAADAAARTG